MSLLTWNDDKHVLGNEGMDRTHHEFAELVNTAWDATDKAAFQVAFSALLDHTEQHFAQEEALMLSSGFPATSEHKAEHERVLAQMMQFNKRVQRGLTQFGREMLKEMPAWFDLHAATMDSALVAHLRGRANT